ncbi:hypothetical protein SAMN05444168_0708 [Paraburkholderia phenazinium]|uniref:Uncharacterized protein n=1 Tax=Paraburkholderia phenazinium TaxID=60549 RepID=A0A1N6EJ69_9BURK|nr:hypothetical protein SAMN05444168_0708 [Paraburkholderia phenazinium]
MSNLMHILICTELMHLAFRKIFLILLIDLDWQEIFAPLFGRAHVEWSANQFSNSYDVLRPPAADLQYPERNQFTDISQRGVRQTLRNRRPLAAGQFAFESIKETIKQFGLRLIQRHGGPTLPETRFGEHGAEGMLGAVHCAVERVEEPCEPGRHVARTFLRHFEDVVVVLALSLNLRRQAVEAWGLPSACSSSKSTKARAIRPLPSSKGSNVTNHRWASPALRTGGSPESLLTQSRNRTVSASSRSAGGASKWTRWRPIGPETTCMGPFASSRQVPTRTRDMPLKPVGNRTACQANRRSLVTVASRRVVASSNISTTPSTCRSTGASAPMSTRRVYGRWRIAVMRR